jgi:hypothetical protein
MREWQSQDDRPHSPTYNGSRTITTNRLPSK